MAVTPHAADARHAGSPALASVLERAWLHRGALSTVLLPLSWLFIAGAAIRGLPWKLGLMRSVRLPVKVVVVGNLIAGGAGKTPTVLAVVALLQRQGLVPGIVSRGYGRRGTATIEVVADSEADDVGDEPLVLQRRARVPVVVGADRVQAVQLLARLHPAVDVIVSDDGHQHRRLHRDAAVLVFDERGIGNGRRLPSGPLREAFPATPPDRSVVLYNTDRPSTPWPGHHGVRHLRPPVALKAWQRGEADLRDDWSEWQGRHVMAAAGVARPERFFTMLRAHGLIVDSRPLPDHFDFARLPWSADGIDVVVTEKDAVKLDASAAANARVQVAALDFALDDAFASALLELLGPGPVSNNRNA